MNNIYLDEKNLDTFVIKLGVDLGGKKYKWAQIFLTTTDEVKVKPLSDRLAEERKKVVQEIKQVCLDEEHKIYDRYDKLNIKIIDEAETGVIDAYEKVIKKLDQIKRGGL